MTRWDSRIYVKDDTPKIEKYVMMDTIKKGGHHPMTQIRILSSINRIHIHVHIQRRIRSRIQIMDPLDP